MSRMCTSGHSPSIPSVPGPHRRRVRGLRKGELLQDQLWLVGPRHHTHPSSREMSSLDSGHQDDHVPIACRAPRQQCPGGRRKSRRSSTRRACRTSRAWGKLVGLAMLAEVRSIRIFSTSDLRRGSRATARIRHPGSASWRPPAPRPRSLAKLDKADRRCGAFTRRHRQAAQGWLPRDRYLAPADFRDRITRRDQDVRQHHPEG